MSRDPGIYDGIPDEEYHRDPALSSSGAKLLLPPSCPALFRHWQINGSAPKRAFDFGHAAHAAVLGVGAEVVVVDAANWTTKAAKEKRDTAYAEGKVPILATEAQQVEEMAAALREHPIAAVLLDPEHGKPEQSVFWHDEQYEVDRRARFDWLPDTDGGRLIIPDYKSAIAGGANPTVFAKAVANYGYHQQAAYYMDAAAALGLAEDIAFVFVVQEKVAPYLVTVAELHPDALHVGRVLNDRALQVFADCSATDTWPSYSDDVALISLPGWATYGLDIAA